MPRKRLGELLVEAGVIDPVQLQAALSEQRRWGRPLGRTLIEMRLVGEKTLVQVLSEQLKIPAVDLDAVQISRDALQRLDATFCLENVCLPFHQDPRGNFLDVAMADPTSQEQFDRIRVRTQSNVRSYLCGPIAIMRHVRAAYLGHQVRGRPEGATDRRFAMPQAGPGRPLQPAPSSQLMLPDEDFPGLVTLDAHPDANVAKQVKQLSEEAQVLRARLERTEHLLAGLFQLLLEKNLCSREELRQLVNKDHR